MLAGLLCVPVFAVEAEQESSADSFDGFAVIADYVDGGSDFFVLSDFSPLADLDSHLTYDPMQGSFVLRASGSTGGSDVTYDFSTASNVSIAPTATTHTFLARRVLYTGQDTLRVSRTGVIVYRYLFSSFSGNIDTLTLAGSVSAYLDLGYGSTSAEYPYQGNAQHKLYGSTLELIVEYSDRPSEVLAVSDSFTLDFGSGTSYALQGDVTALYLSCTNTTIPTSLTTVISTSGDYRGFSFIASARLGFGLSGNYTDMRSTYALLSDILTGVTNIYGGLFPSIPDKLDAIKTAIDNLGNATAVSPGDQQVAADMRDKMEQISGQIADASQKIDELTQRPEPSAIVPSAPDILTTTDVAAVSAVDAYKSILATPLVLQMLLVLFGLAFLHYVLFGKGE